MRRATSVLASEHDTASAPGGLAPLCRWVVALGGVVFAVLMAVSGRYGFHRDELYFLDCARHLQGGYVDQPVLVPLLARVSLDLFGVSVVGLRVWSALAAWATVVLGGLLAREFGGSRWAQLVAAVAVGTSPVLWGADHVLSTTGFDVLAWAGLALVVVRIGRTGDTRWWLVGGLVLGVGLANKHLVGFFAVALFVGALLSGGRRLVLNRWFLAGAVIAALFTVPDLWWQAGHGWASFAMTRSLSQQNGGLVNAVAWVFGQLAVMLPVAVWVWIEGLRFLWRSGRPLWRSLVWAYGLLFVVFALTTGAQGYYLAGAYVYLVGAGAVAVEGWLFAERRRLRVLSIVTGVLTVALLLWMLPVLPARVGGALAYQDGQETIGWPELVGTVRSVWRSLPPARRAGAVVFTGDYSEAGAINELGRGHGLPTAVSAQNNEWFWGPGKPGATTVVAVVPGSVTNADSLAYLHRFFGKARLAATITNRPGVHNKEWGDHVYVCTDPRERWSRMWPELRHYD